MIGRKCNWQSVSQYTLYMHVYPPIRLKSYEYPWWPYAQFHTPRRFLKGSLSSPLYFSHIVLLQLTEAGSEGMCISVDPGTYSITAGQWGGVQTQTHIVKLGSGQSANLDFVF